MLFLLLFEFVEFCLPCVALFRGFVEGCLHFVDAFLGFFGALFALGEDGCIGG